MIVDILKISQNRKDGTITKEIIGTEEVDEGIYLKPLLKIIINSVEKER